MSEQPAIAKAAPTNTCEDEVVQRMRTFTLLKWCGMPNELNPRKLAKLGFICVDNFLLQCADEINCAQKVQL